MDVVIITGSSGLVGSAASKFFASKGLQVIGIDNNMRKSLFGDKGSTENLGLMLSSSIKNFELEEIDIRDFSSLETLFKSHSENIRAVIHCAGQPSHDWAARDPITDFTINANGTLNLLELTRRHAAQATFVFMSTNKVYGDRPNEEVFEQHPTRWSPSPMSRWVNGFDESLSIDDSTHSLFGVSKASADLMVQEYGRYFELNTAVFRGGCLTGPNHASVELHGFLSYLVKCAVHQNSYTIFGHLGKQVRDNLHTKDLVNAFWRFIEKPTKHAVYNRGGGAHANTSILEAIEIIDRLTNNRLAWSLSDLPRKGDHKWYVSDTSRFERDYPGWGVTIGIEEILTEMVELESARR
jgi:CDP-paratose 2-epimerase